jgi:hypothetical protein
MPVSTADVVATLSTSIATAVVTAVVTVRLSVRQFKSERWWERKVDAYTRIVEAIQSMYRAASEEFDASVSGRELQKDYSDRLWAGWNSGRDELQRAIGYGSLVISSETYRALMTLEDALDAGRREPSWTERLDAYAAALAECLGEVRRLAAKDLGVMSPTKLSLKMKSDDRTLRLSKRDDG